MFPELLARSKKKITVPAPCKINLFLEVTGRRSDGYHEIDTVMQTVGLCDRLIVSFDPSESGIALSCQKKYIPVDSGNVAWRCAERFLAETGKSGRVEIILDNRIPVAAGLGGGSTDGAAVLRALNALTGAGLGTEELCAIGAKLGADIPFCIRGGCARATGVGEIFSEARPLHDMTPLIAVGGHGSSTPAAYKALDDLGYTGDRTAEAMLSALERNDHAAIAEEAYNAFEPVVFEKNRDAEIIKRRMRELGAFASMMSGSGAAVFGLFAGRNHAKSAVRAMRVLREEGYFAVTAPLL